MNVLIVADTDLDGVGSAVIITKYYEMFFGSKIPFKKGLKIDVRFPSRSGLDDMFSDVEGCQKILEDYDRIYLCDTLPNSLDACKNIGTILAPKTTVFDHHATNRTRLQPYAKNFTNPNEGGLHILEGPHCSTKVAFDVLKHGLHDTPGSRLNVFMKFVGLVNDLDLWYRRYPRSTELGDYVAVVGAKAAYPTLLKIADRPDDNVDDMGTYLARVEKEKRRSLSLGQATLVKHKGYKTPFYTCFVDDWASWVGAELVANTGVIAMFDVSRKNLGFRVGPRYLGTAWHKAKGTKPNCLDFAEPLGGGGHPQAAGVSTGEASPIFKQLSEKLGEILLEDYHERSRKPA